MTFLNWILLGGAAAAVIPILIHLLHRSRFQIVRWGAMHLLRASTSRKRRIRIEQLVLLAVRASILLVLALCMARPVLTGVRALLGGSKSSVAVVLDNSLSMNAREQGRTRLERAREEVAAMLGALPRGSEMFVVWMAGAEPPAIGPSYDPARVAGEMNAQRAAGGAADPAAALATAAGLLAKAHYPNREVLVVSDFQRVNWTPFGVRASARTSTETNPALARSLDLLKKGPLPPRLTLLPMGRETIENVAVEAVSVARPVVGVGQRVAVRATIRNYGVARADGQRVYFRVDGEERAASPLALDPGQSGQVVFYHAFDTPGSHAFEVALDADALAADNARGAAVIAWTRVPVLLASDDPGLDPRTGDAMFLEAALQPYRAAGESGGETDLFELKTASLATAPPDLSQVRAVAIANARDIPSAWIKPLDAFVREGGGLLVFPGERTRPDGYRRLFQDKRYRFLPAAFDNKKGDSPLATRHSPLVNKTASVAAGRFEHPALALFNDPRGGNLAGAAIARWYPLQTDRSAPAPPPKRNGRARNIKEEDPPPPEGKLVVAARLDTGEPFLVERQYGRGRAIVCATACDDAWSNLPSRPFYLPLMQQLMVYLASRDEPPRTLEVGQPLAALAPAVDESAMLTTPDGRTHELRARGAESSSAGGSAGILPASLFEFGATWTPGVYRLATLGKGLAGETIRFAVNPPLRESEPALLDRPALESLANEPGAKILDSAEDYVRVEKDRRFGHELWKPLLALVLALFFLELVLEQRFGRLRNL